ncbi:hypothetical protein ACB092_10G013600 [Castanea dentata]
MLYIYSQYAIVGTKNTNIVYHGGSDSISIYNPKVEGTHYSSARIKVINGPESIEVGWTVNSTLYNDTQTRLYTFTKTSSSSCFNTLCKSIIPTSTDIPLGIPIAPIATPKQQFDMKFMLFWDSSNGNWFLKFGQDETEIGFWPKNVFTALGDGANYVERGGEVFSPPDVPSPPMGLRILETYNETPNMMHIAGKLKQLMRLIMLWTLLIPKNFLTSTHIMKFLMKE